MSKKQRIVELEAALQIIKHVCTNTLSNQIDDISESAIVEPSLPHRTISKKGKYALLQHEAIALEPYRCPAGVMTVFVGHTYRSGDPDPAKMKTERWAYDVKDALRVFCKDLEKFEERVTLAFKERPLNQHQFDAAVSFDFNTGAINTATWVQLFIDGAESEVVRKWFEKWRKPKSIIPRRVAEMDMFFNGTYPKNTTVLVLSSLYIDKNGDERWGVRDSVALDTLDNSLKIEQEYGI